MSASASTIATGWPTAEDLEFFNKFVDVYDATDMVRMSSRTLRLPPCRIKFKNIENLPRGTLESEHMGRLIDIFIRKMIQKANGNLKTTKYWINLQHPAYLEKDGFWIMHKTYEMANGHTLMNIINKQSQSREELVFDETLVISMRVFTSEDLLPGRGNRIPEQVLKKFGVDRPYVLGDGHCLPKAVAIGKYWSDMNNLDNDEETRKANEKIYEKLTRTKYARSSRLRLQQEEAEKLLEAAQLDPLTEEHNTDDLAQLALYLPQYHICVWTLQLGVQFPTVIFERNAGARNLIPLFYTENHYEFFQPTCAHVAVRFCFNCHKLASKKHWKRCKAKCKRCGQLKCEATKPSKYCAECNIWFHSEKCYENHLKANKSNSMPYCEKYEKCTLCCVIHRREGFEQAEHVCFHQDYCPVCREKISGRHECVNAPPTEALRKRLKKKQEKWVIVVYDCESIVTSTAEYTATDSLGVKHVPNVLSYRLLCQDCLGNYCQTCGDIQVLSYKLRTGEVGTVMDRFIKFLKNDPRLKNAYIIAHNGGRYDHVFTIEELMKGEFYSPNFIMSGRTFISVDVTISKFNTLHFRDSVKYIPMRLSQLPSAFELETEDKGHFPYMYNHPGNYGSRLPKLPPIEYYEPHLMNPQQRKVFEEWYNENQNNPFDFDEEIVKYCKNDVQILSEAIIKFIKICQSSFGGWNPIIQSTTLAAYVMHVMKHEHIKDKIIGYIPENGWSTRNNSKLALKYLLWLENKNPGLQLRHTLRKGGEYIVACGGQSFAVDGYNPETNEVFEVHGCMYHGCPKCFLDRERTSPHNKNRKMQELYDETMMKDHTIQEAGYNLHVIWECDMKNEIRQDAEMETFFKLCNHVHQLYPREAMFGGRTQQFKSLAEANAEYSIEYYDFCSLYPFINIKGTEYPIGTPDVYNEYFKEIIPGEPLPYRGLAFCDVLAPTNCPIPVLPFRFNSKLLFPLCRTCATNDNEKTPPIACSHTKVTERYFTGVWCTDELNLAISEGYQILKLHEVWHWKEDKWFRGGFFQSFMAPLLKMKHESSGWPRPDMTEEDKRAHIATIFENDGVELDAENVKKNPAMRSLSKLFLNSTWGKFAQNPQKAETKLIPEGNGVKIAEFFEDPFFEPRCFIPWGNTHVLGSRKPIKDSLKTAKYTNIVYGALTTSAARIKLFEPLKRIGPDNLLYCDTDSIIFRQRRGENVLGDLRGEALGKLTNEVKHGWSIQEFVSLAPKVYALKMIDSAGNVDYSSKAKGCILNSETSHIVNFETMKEMMIKQLQGEQTEFTVKRVAMKRGKNALDGIKSVIEQKRLRPVMDKGLFTEDGSLIPFGTMHNAEIVNDYPF